MGESAFYTIYAIHPSCSNTLTGPQQHESLSSVQFKCCSCEDAVAACSSTKLKFGVCGTGHTHARTHALMWALIAFAPSPSRQWVNKTILKYITPAGWVTCPVHMGIQEVSIPACAKCKPWPYLNSFDVAAEGFTWGTAKQELHYHSKVWTHLLI